MGDSVTFTSNRFIRERLSRVECSLDKPGLAHGRNKAWQEGVQFTAAQVKKKDGRT